MLHAANGVYRARRALRNVDVVVEKDPTTDDEQITSGEWSP
jgi:hypothetical protein